MSKTNTAIPKTELVSVDRIFLDLENPRHERYTSEAEVIEYLCRNDYVHALAKDIVKLGLNPLELFALIPGNKRRGTATYTVAEGNRRMCAIKLLNDPDLAPAKLRREFKQLSEKSTVPKSVPAVIFASKEQVDIWLERIHGGTQGGVGRKSWNSEQKTRHLGDKKNALAQVVLDYAEKRKFITSDERKGKLTTAQRYLSNAVFREALGIDNTKIEDISRTRSEDDFDILIKKFVTDLVSNEVHSRSNSEDIKSYARNLGAIRGLSGKRNSPESLELPVGGKRKRRTPKEPQKPKHVAYEEDISKLLNAMPSYKLEKLYYSICDISLESHTPLISVGVWSFFESLTAVCGRDSGTAFASFLSKSRLNSLGFMDKEEVNSIQQAVERIARYGNTTKHHHQSANFNGEQLANDMGTLKGLICKLAEAGKL